MLSVLGVNAGSSAGYPQYRSKVQSAGPNFTSNIVDCSEYKKAEDKSNNGKFDWSEAGKNFIRGILSPVTAAIKHPLATLGVVVGTVAACSFVPVLGAALAIGFGAYSVAQIGKGCYDVAKNCVNGQYDDAEKSFDTVGQGTIGTILSVLGIKQSAKVAQEAKLMSELSATTLSEAQKAEIAANVKNAGFYNNLKESLSLFTTKNGLKASLAQFKPDMLKARWNDIKNIFTKTKIVKEAKEEKVKRRMSTEQSVAEFKKTPEGIRRAALTDKQVEAEVQSMYNRVFDELGVPKDHRPKLEIKTGDVTHGGSYARGKHTLEFNPECYRSGVMEMEDVIMHEATHCKEALLRAGIPKERAQAIVRDELLSRIQNGEAEEIIVSGNFLGAEMMKPPKMSVGMKSDFAQFAKDVLYDEKLNLDGLLRKVNAQKRWQAEGNNLFNAENLEEAEKAVEPIMSKIKGLLAKHPEFSKQYKTSEEALEALTKYATSHNARYNSFSNVRINVGSSYKPQYLDIKLTPEELAYAEKSLIDSITTIEGNSRISGLRGIFASNKSFNQYQFSPEEVLAQRNGNTFLIDTIQAKIDAMRKAGTLSAEDEAYLTGIIEKAKAVIEYKTKGLEYYEKYTQMINNPGDKALADAVKALEQELIVLEENTHVGEYEILTRVVRNLKLADHASFAIPSSAIYEILSAMKGDK